MRLDREQDHSVAFGAHRVCSAVGFAAACEPEAGKAHVDMYAVVPLLLQVDQVGFGSICRPRHAGHW